VAQGSFYTYFPNKQAAFEELVRSLSDDLVAALATATQDAATRLDAERLGLEAFFAFTLEHQSLYRIIRQAEFVNDGLYRAYYQRIATGYERGLREAMDAGEVRELDPKAVAWALMGMADFLGMRWVLWKGELPPRAVVDSALSLIRAGLSPNGAVL